MSNYKIGKDIAALEADVEELGKKLRDVENTTLTHDEWCAFVEALEQAGIGYYDENLVLHAGRRPKER